MVLGLTCGLYEGSCFAARRMLARETICLLGCGLKDLFVFSGLLYLTFCSGRSFNAILANAIYFKGEWVYPFKRTWVTRSGSACNTYMGITGVAPPVQPSDAAPYLCLGLFPCKLQSTTIAGGTRVHLLC